MSNRRYIPQAIGLILLVTLPVQGMRSALADGAPNEERHLLYVATPGIRDDAKFGGAGIVVFDIDRGHAFVRRIETPASRRPRPEAMKGICANASTHRLYLSTPTRLYCLDLKTDERVWEKALPGGCDRMSMTPDGRRLYVPSLEGPHWNVVDAATGDVLTKIETGSGSHNTVCSVDGSRAYLAGLRSPFLSVLDTQTQSVVNRVGPFGGSIRPFTVNSTGTRCFVTVNDLLGFEIGDLRTGKVLHRVVVQGFQKGPTKRHGCPSHGIGLSPDDREIWVCDAANRRVHVFDVTSIPPRQTASIKLREQPGWVTFSVDGRFAYPSTGDVVDARTKKVVAGLHDDTGREVHSEKLLEVDFKDGMPIRAGDQFGIGRASAATPASGAR
jgi:DNA-binding beta-propeller fold protein YncE